MTTNGPNCRPKAPPRFQMSSIPAPAAKVYECALWISPKFGSKGTSSDIRDVSHELTQDYELCHTFRPVAIIG